MENIKFFDMVLLEKPLCLSVGSKRFKLYQPTIGKLILIRPLLEKIAADGELIDNIALEVILKTATHRDAICEILALHSFSDSKHCLDPFKIEERAKEFAALDNGDISALFLATLSFPKADAIISGSEIEKDNGRRQRLYAVKDKDGCAVCGGNTLYGGILDHAMERYGWSLQYTLWGISAANLQLLAADEQVSVYLSPDERKKANPVDVAGKNAINGDDPENASRIIEIFNRQNRQ